MECARDVPGVKRDRGSMVGGDKEGSGRLRDEEGNGVELFVSKGGWCFSLAFVWLHSVDSRECGRGVPTECGDNPRMNGSSRPGSI